MSVLHLDVGVFVLEIPSACFSSSLSVENTAVRLGLFDGETPVIVCIGVRVLSEPTL
jgi:hypothetical protein